MPERKAVQVKMEGVGNENGTGNSGSGRHRKIPERVKNVLYAVLIAAGIVMIVLSGRYLSSERYGNDPVIEGDVPESDEGESPRFFWMLM